LISFVKSCLTKPFASYIVNPPCLGIGTDGCFVCEMILQRIATVPRLATAPRSRGNTVGDARGCGAPTFGGRPYVAPYSRNGHVSIADGVSFDPAGEVSTGDAPSTVMGIGSGGWVVVGCQAYKSLVS
jgi:hypothetical protein